MARVNDGLTTFLMDVALDGAAIINKRKLLWMMGKSNDKPAAWEELATNWEDLGFDRAELLGTEVYGKILLMRKSATQVEPVDKWT